MFNECKAAQMAAFFLGQVPEGRMPHLKLMKLLYLSDREAVRAFGWPMSGDRWVSMPHGPVLSQTLNLMDGDVESCSGGWEVSSTQAGDAADSVWAARGSAAKAPLHLAHRPVCR